MRRVIEIGMLGVAVVVAALSAAGTAFPVNGASLKVNAPSSVKLGSTYTVTVSGTTGTGADNQLVAFQGGGKKALPCYGNWGGEANRYPKNELTQQYAVHGSFTKSFTFLAAHAGPKGFCVYLRNSKYPTAFLNNYAFASASWTVS